MTNLVKNVKTKKKNDEFEILTQLIIICFLSTENFQLEKYRVHLELLSHLFSSFLSLSYSPSRIIIILSFLFLSLSFLLFFFSFSLALPLSLSLFSLSTYSINRRLLLLLSENDQVANHKTKICLY